MLQRTLLGNALSDRTFEIDGLLSTMDKNIFRNDDQSSNAPENDRISDRDSADLMEKWFLDSFEGAILGCSTLNFVR